MNSGREDNGSKEQIDLSHGVEEKGSITGSAGVANDSTSDKFEGGPAMSLGDEGDPKK